MCQSMVNIQFPTAAIRRGKKRRRRRKKKKETGWKYIWSPYYIGRLSSSFFFFFFFSSPNLSGRRLDVCHRGSAPNMGMFLIWAPLISVPYVTCAKEVRRVYSVLRRCQSLLNIFWQVYEFKFLQERCKFEIVVLAILLKSLNILL